MANRNNDEKSSPAADHPELSFDAVAPPPGDPSPNQGNPPEMRSAIGDGTYDHLGQISETKTPAQALIHEPPTPPLAPEAVEGHRRVNRRGAPVISRAPVGPALYPKSGSSSLQEVMNWVYTGKWSSEGCICPACGLRLQVYRRSVTWAMCAGLTLLWYETVRRATPDNPFPWIHVTAHLHANTKNRTIRGDITKYAYWELMIEQPTEKDEPSNGYWKLTPNAVEFLRGRLRLPRYFWVCHDTILAESVERVGIESAVNGKFDYQQIVTMDPVFLLQANMDTYREQVKAAKESAKAQRLADKEQSRSASASHAAPVAAA